MLERVLRDDQIERLASQLFETAARQFESYSVDQFGVVTLELVLGKLHVVLVDVHPTARRAPLSAE